MAAGSALCQIEERDNFFKLTLLVFRDGNEKLREFFKSRWPVVYQNMKGTPPLSAWTDIPNDATEMKNTETKPLNFKFNDQKANFDSGNTKTWDFTLLRKVLEDSTLKFVTPSSPEKAAIKELKDIRDKLIGHAPDATLQTAVFNTEWPKACNALNVFGLTQDEIDQVIEDVKKPIDVLIPILKEVLINENEILDAIKRLEERMEILHEETITTIKEGNETIIHEIRKSTEPKKWSTEDLRITETQRALLDDSLEHFTDVNATDLLELLPCLSQEHKDEITKTARLNTKQTTLKSLIDAIKTCENGFEMFVRSLVLAGLAHVAVLLDPDCEGHVSVESEDSEASCVSITGTVVDIRIPVRITYNVQSRKLDIEAKIAKKYMSSNSEDCKELRRAFSKHLLMPRGVHFVHTKQFGESTSNNDTTSNNPNKDSIVFIFRMSKERAVDDMNKIHSDNTLKTIIKEVLDLKSFATDMNELDLELVCYQKSNYQDNKKKFGQDPSTDVVVDAPEETKDKSTEEITHKMEKVKIRKVYLDGHYHKEIKLRDYQKELAAPALAGQNTIICAPTNSGKTFVAMEIAKRHLEAHRETASNDSRKVIFVVNKQNLVLQQRSRFEDYLSAFKTSDLSGSNSTSISLDSLLKHCDVVVLTAQILVNALEDKRVTLAEISLLIFDECHHTNKEEPYNKIMMHYIERRESGEMQLPQVVGLTASLGVGQATSLYPAIDHVLQICANLDTNTIATVQEHKTDLQYHVTGDVPDMKIITVPNNEPNVFDVEVNKTMKEIETHMSVKYGGCDDAPISNSRQHESYRQWIELLEQCASTNHNNELPKCAEHLRKYHESLLINNFTRIQDALSFLEEYDHHQYTEICPWLEQIYQQTLARIKASTDQSSNPLLVELERIIVDFYECETDGNPKGIVFCRTRSYAAAIKKWMMESETLSKILKPEVLLGSGRGKHGQTQPEQESVIRKFKNGDVNIVIATSVAEEGLDISDCKYVIRYDVKTNEISSVQSRGRIRAKEGTYVYLSDNRSRGAEHELKNQSKETLMNQAVQAVQMMNRGEYNKKIKSLQNETLDSFRSKKEQEASPKQALDESERRRLLCRRCNAYMCDVQDLRLLDKIHHVVINNDIYKRMDVINHPKPKNTKIHCKECKLDWGIIFRSKQHDFPCIKSKSIKLPSNNEESGLYKSWKDFPYSVTAFSSTLELVYVQANIQQGITKDAE